MKISKGFTLIELYARRAQARKGFTLIELYARRAQARKGFTLIELIIVITIAGVLAVVLITALNPGQQLKKSRDAGRKAALKQVQNALEQYYNDTGGYPMVSCWSGSASCWTISGLSALLGSKASTYIPGMPTDPVQTGISCADTASRGYYYYTPDIGKTYKLITAMENTSDSSAMPGAPTYYSNAVDGGGCSASFNFKLVSQQQ